MPFFIPVVLMGYCDRKNYPALSYPILILRAALEIVMFSTFILAIQSLSLGLAGRIGINDAHYCRHVRIIIFG
jgi:hypothetical protein